MAKWGNHRAKAEADVRSETHRQKVERQNGRSNNGTNVARGEAITRRADLDEAARNERKGR